MNEQAARKLTPQEAYEQIEAYQKYEMDIVESTTRFRNNLTQLSQKYSVEQFTNCEVQPLLITSLLEQNATRLIYDFERLQIPQDRLAKLNGELKAAQGWSKDNQLLIETTAELETAMIEIQQNIFKALQKFSHDEQIFINEETDELAQQLCDMYGEATRGQMLLRECDETTFMHSEFSGFEFTDEVEEQFVGDAPQLPETGMLDYSANIALGQIDFNASE